MARIIFTAIVAEIIGKLAGSVFQYSYGGFQLHTKGKPRNPQTQYQQLRRGDFGFLAASYRSLTSAEQQTWIDNAPSGQSAFNFFIESNVNLILIGEPTITSYIPTSVPADMPITPVDITPTIFTIQASGPTTTVPTGTALAVFTTSQKLPSRLFTNPSEYSPILTLPAGTDLSTPADILSSYITRFGQIDTDKLICVKSALIDIANGNRTDTSPSCTITEAMANKYIPLFIAPGQVSNVTSSTEDINTYTIPANTIQAAGDRLLVKFLLTRSGSGGFINTIIRIAGNNLWNNSFNNSQTPMFECIFAYSGSNVMNFYFNVSLPTASVLIQSGSFAFNPAVANDITIRVATTAAGQVTIQEEAIDLIKAP